MTKKQHSTNRNSIAFQNIFTERNFYYLIAADIEESDANTLAFYLEQHNRNERIIFISEIDDSVQGAISYRMVLESGEVTKTITHNLPFAT